MAQTRVELMSQAYEARVDPPPLPRKSPVRFELTTLALGGPKCSAFGDESTNGKIRTCDTTVMSGLLCLLSYTGEAGNERIERSPAGLESAWSP